MMGEVTWFSPIGWHLLVGAFGLAFGSFANVLIIRLREQTSLLGRSRCVSCHKTLQLHHLIPLISWMGLRGRCAFCHAPISWQYPIVEFLSCLFVLVAAARHPFFTIGTWQSLSFFLFEYFLTMQWLVLAVFDFRWRLVPVEYAIGSALVFGAGSLALGRVSWMMMLVGALVGFSFLAFQAWVSRGRWLGWGDPWLGLLLGVVLGWPLIGVRLYATYVGGGVIALFLLGFGWTRRGARVPFGPFLMGGGVVALWYGSSLLSWLATWWR